MPYIPKERADAINAGEAPQNAGELTYLLSEVVAAYVLEHGTRYQRMAEVHGALASTADEFLVRVQRPYEELKRIEGGADPFAPIAVIRNGPNRL